MDGRGCTQCAPSDVRASVPGALITRTVYVVDTSVLLADPSAVTRFAEHEVVLPLVVLTELEGKRHHPELGWAARQSLRFLEELRTRHGSLLEPMPVNDDGGTLRVELNHQELGRRCPDRSPRRPTTTASSPSPATSAARAATSSSSPRTCRCASRPASSASTPTSTATSWPPTTSWTGFVELDVVERGDRRALRAERVVDLAAARDLPLPHRRRAARRLAVGARPRARRQAPAPRAHRRTRCSTCAAARPSSASPSTLLDDPEIGIVSLGGNAGTGKSVLALAAGLEAVLERRTHQRVVVFRPIYAVGGQDLGYLPGTEAEKMVAVGRRGHRRARVDGRAAR